MIYKAVALEGIIVSVDALQNCCNMHAVSIFFGTILRSAPVSLQSMGG